MKKFSYQDISKQINYDVVEVLEVKLIRVEARKKRKNSKKITNYLPVLRNLHSKDEIMCTSQVFCSHWIELRISEIDSSFTL